MFRSQNVLTIISVALMLFFSGLYVIISWQSDYFLDVIKEKIDLLIELDDDLETEELDAFKEKLNEMEAVKDGSVTYLSKEDAMREMEEEFGEDFFLEDMGNPFKDALTFRLKSEFYTDRFMREIKEDLEAETFVKRVSYRKDIFEPLQRNMNRISRIISILGTLLIFGALILIHNTLKLSLNSQRKVIKTMELVGAKSSFILKPFIGFGVLQGFISGFLASLGIIGTLYLIGEWVPVFKTLYTTERTYIVLGSLLLMGILIYVVVTYYTVSRYLRIQMEDIF